MYRTIADFVEDWSIESAATLKVLNNLTDASLDQRIAPESRSLGRLAWHVTGSITGMLGQAGLTVGGPTDHDPQPPAAAVIAAAYERAARVAAEQIESRWTDAMLDETVEMFGRPWKRGAVLSTIIRHQAHHRGQMTVLMRQAGLVVPGVYGPSREEWVAQGMPALP
ncbi:MAG TPA: DinB family protein [Longimicrobiales bacterium]